MGVLTNKAVVLKTIYLVSFRSSTPCGRGVYRIVISHNRPVLTKAMHFRSGEVELFELSLNLPNGIGLVRCRMHCYNQQILSAKMTTFGNPKWPHFLYHRTYDWLHLNNLAINSLVSLSLKTFPVLWKVF